jgi:surface carbohydrate biosynthesis protein (TIGR04326 family)
LSEIVIWDRKEQTQSFLRHQGTTVLWQGHYDSALSRHVSVLELVEANPDIFKEKYLAWVYDLGETRIDNRRLIDCLQLRPGFSYWWMTPLVEKCNYDTSPWIDDAIKLMAFDHWAKKQSISRISLVSANENLAMCLRAWCKNSGVLFEWKKEAESLDKTSITRRIYQKLPEILMAGIWLIRYIITRWPLRGVGVKQWRESDAKVSFVSYLFNIQTEYRSKNQIESSYWRSLPFVLSKKNCKTNWLYIFVNSDPSTPTQKVLENLHDLNMVSDSNQVHVTLDSFISVSVILLTLRDWIGLIVKARGLEKKVVRKNSALWCIWPLYASEWRKSLIGIAAMSNLLYLNLFEAAMRMLPKQEIGVYLKENQGWESGLLQAWKASGHGEIIGSAHSTVRYWDLRYFFDSRSYNTGNINPMPMPTKVAVNGDASFQAFSEGGYPSEDTIGVEALRYLYLIGIHDKQPREHSITKQGTRLLVLGDFTTRNTRVQMHMLENVWALLPAGTEITVKPHPACPIDPYEYPNMTFTLTTEPLAKLLPEYHIAYVSAATSAAVDAYCSGIPVISVLDTSALNQSPLRGRKDVQFVSTCEELARSLEKMQSLMCKPVQGKDFFYLDNDLPRWKAIFSLRENS